MLNQGFEEKLRDTISALDEVLTIYGGDGQNISAIDAKKISRLLSSIRSDARSLFDDKVIYLFDDRKNLYDATGFEKLAAKSVAVLVDTLDLLDTGNGNFNLPGSGKGLCPTERFAAEAAPGWCTAFRVGPDILATAGHCIKNQFECNTTSFVFDFAYHSKNDTPQKNISKDRVYSCRSLVAGELGGGDQNDWRLVKLDREIDATIPTVSLRATGRPDLGDPITIIGHPIGLPLKVTPGGTVRSLQSTYFVANPDTYGGNSGSPAFNSSLLSQGELFAEGILVRGEDDFEQTYPCVISKICPLDGCRGEDVNYANKAADVIGAM